MGDTVVSDNPPLEVVTESVEVEKKTTTLDSPPGFAPLSLDVQSKLGAELGDLMVEKEELSDKVDKDNSGDIAVGESVDGEKGLGLSLKEKVDGSWLVKFAAVTTTTSEVPAVETVKRKRGRPVKNKVAWNTPLASSASPTVANGSNGTNGMSPSLVSSVNRTNGVSPSLASSSPTPNSNEMTIEEIMKRKERKPMKIKSGRRKRKLGKDFSGGSSPAPSSAPAQGAIEMSSAELVKKRRGRQPKVQKDQGKGSEEAASSEISLPKKGGGRWPNSQNSLSKKNGNKEPITLEPSLPTPDAAEPPRTEMSLRPTPGRTAGRHATPKRKYQRKNRSTSTGLASSSGANKQSSLHGEATTEEPDQNGDGLSTPPEPSTVKPSPKRGIQSPSKRGKKQKLAQQVDSSREQMVADKDITEVIRGLGSTFYVGDVPIPGEYEQIYKDIKDRHGPLENNQLVGSQDALSYVTLVELLKMAHKMKSLAMDTVTETTLADFEKNLAVGKIFNYNVGCLEENVKRLRELYARRAALDVGTLEQDVQSCNTWLEVTKAELVKMEEAYLSAKRKVDDLVKSRDDAVAKLVAARDRLGQFEYIV